MAHACWFGASSWSARVAHPRGVDTDAKLAQQPDVSPDDAAVHIDRVWSAPPVDADYDVDEYSSMLDSIVQETTVELHRQQAAEHKTARREREKRAKRRRAGLPEMTPEERAALPKVPLPQPRPGAVHKPGTRLDRLSHPDTKRTAKTGVNPWYRA